LVRIDARNLELSW